MVEIVESFLNLVFPKDKKVQELEVLTAQDLKEKLPEASCSDPDLISLFNYKDSKVRQLIWEIKYKKNKKLAFMCAELISEQLLEYMYEKKEFNPNSKFILLPVPISKKRKRHRGYNQTELLAEYVNKMLPPIIYCNKTLRRDIDRPSQTKKTNKEREENVKGCFSIINGQRVRDNIVIILDDVTTTGATIKNVCEQVSKHGPKDILRVTVAH